MTNIRKNIHDAAPCAQLHTGMHTEQKSIFDFSGPGMAGTRQNMTNTPSPEQSALYDLWTACELAQDRINPEEAPAAYLAVDAVNWSLFHAWETVGQQGAKA